MSNSSTMFTKPCSSYLWFLKKVRTMSHDEPDRLHSMVTLLHHCTHPGLLVPHVW